MPNPIVRKRWRARRNIPRKTFVDRRQELAQLNDAWASGHSELYIVYGKRRVGKTELLKHFAAAGPRIYFLADRRPDRQQLLDLAQRVGAAMGDRFVGQKGFSDWLEPFRYLEEKTEDRWLLIMDEFPYLVENNPTLPSLLQKAWDEHLKGTRAFVVLCGSSIGMMESLLASRSPIHGRRTGSFEVKPFTFQQLKELLPRKSFEERMEYYSLLGGMPGYIAQFDLEANVEENLKRNFLKPDCFLYREVEFLVREELREPRYYLAILQAVALGKHKFGEIANATGLGQNILSKYLQILERLHLIVKDYPVTEPRPLKSKTGLYFIKDNFVRSWFELLLPYRSELELGNYSSSLKRWKEGRLLSAGYEQVSRELAREYWIGKGISVNRLGKWWAKDAELDIVGYSEESGEIIFGEAKWSNKKVGINIYQHLKNTAGQVQWGKPDRSEHFCLFSRSGFTPEMIALARQEKVTLFHGDRVVSGK
ncbi:MAG: ATP-binding protein [Candidatus Edwardsbacteria bacterium]|nr:ATP-binding protein [Candidatus Edwardsbacteria bacterium]